MADINSTMPSDYVSALDEVAPGISGIVAQQTQGDETWYEALTRSMPNIVTTIQQREILRAQIDRARQGLPPLDVAQYGVGVAPGAANPLIVYGLLGAGLLFLLSRRRS